MKVLNCESVELRKAHDNAMKELDEYKEENRRLTEELLRLKQCQMDKLDQLNEEYEKFKRMNLDMIKQESCQIVMEPNDTIIKPLENFHAVKEDNYQ